MPYLRKYFRRSKFCFKFGGLAHIFVKHSKVTNKKVHTGISKCALFAKHVI